MDQPLTRAELEELLTRFAQSIDKRFDDLSAQVADVRAETERVETSLLTEFHKWARTHEIRSRGVSTAVVGFDERLSLIEDRLSEVERKLHQK